MQRAMRLATFGREYPWYGCFAEPPFSEPPSALLLLLIHEHSATVAERFRSGRHRSDGETRAWPKVPSAVGDRAGYPRETGRRNRKRGERGKKGGGREDKRREGEKSRGSGEFTRATVPGVCVSSLVQSPSRGDENGEVGGEGKMSPA